MLRREIQKERKVSNVFENTSASYRVAMLDRKKRNLAKLLDIKDDFRTANSDRKTIEKVKSIK